MSEPKPGDVCKCGQIFVSVIHSGVEGGHQFEPAKTAEPDKRELDIRRLMAKIGETFILGADHFFKLWPSEKQDVIREAIKRLESPVPRTR